MNITKESLEQELEYVQRVIALYNHNPEYNNPNISLQQAEDLVRLLEKELYLYGKQID